MAGHAPREFSAAMKEVSPSAAALMATLGNMCGEEMKK